MNTAFSSILLQWFADNGRELPWRQTRNPYAIWLSEVILQQTRVQQGMDYWYRFMKRFPTVDSLAAASEDEVMRLWQGLGYYARARHLHEAARQIAGMGSFPDTYESILKLSGVGPYTAAAVAAFAFDRPVAAVDGNVYRVLARYFAIDTPINSTEGKKLFASLAQELLPASRAADFNQAMMDFGATQCTPQSPRCGDCPFAETCGALREGKVELLPVKLKTVKVQTRPLSYLIILYKEKIALRRRSDEDIWKGLWEPVDLLHLPADYQALADKNGQWQLVAKGAKHILTHRRLIADFYLWQPQEELALPPDYQWIELCHLDDYGLPRLIEKVLKESVL